MTWSLTGWGAFTYSPEEELRLLRFEDQVDEELKKDWQADVMELQEEVIFDKNEEMKRQRTLCVYRRTGRG